MKIAMLQLGYESNTFVSGRAQIPDLGSGGWIRAETVIPTFTGTHTAMGGILDTLAQFGDTPVPVDQLSRGGAFNAGPAMSRECIEDSIRHICAMLEEVEFDGICCVIHGAGCGDGYEDADGYWLEELRRVAASRPIHVTLDLHAVITGRMVKNADGLYGIKTHPHVDYYEAGCRNAEQMCQRLRGQIRPQMAFQPIPMLVPAAFATTLEGLGKELKEAVDAYCVEHGLLDVSYFHAFSAADTPGTSASVVAIADGFLPDKEAWEAAQLVWNRRQEYMQPTNSAAQAVDKALALRKDGYVVINDGNDNPGGGNPGDGTWLLQELVSRDLPGTIFGPFFDPAAAELCHSHRVGERFALSVGGHTDAAYGPTLELEVTLLALSDGCFTCANPMYGGAKMCHGPSARVAVGNVELILVSRRFQTYDDRPFAMTGANVADYRLVALKSENHFRAYFRPIADGIVSAHTPSIFPADIRELPYEKVLRPMYPLDPDTEFPRGWTRQ